jgi:non-ribosomal peptide synthase protein (TIGR01720 family)
VSVRLDPDDTATLLRTAPSAYRSRITDVLLAALVRAVSGWTGDGAVSVDLEGHGREEIFDDIDVSRTVGWFTSVYPVTLDTPEAGTGWRQSVLSVRRRLRTVPDNGIGYGALRYLGDALGDRKEPDLAFNYLGQWDGAAGGTDSDAGGLIGAVHASLGQDHDPAQPPSHLIEVVGGVQDGEMTFSWFYRPDRYHESTVRAVANEFAAALRAIAADCRETK